MNITYYKSNRGFVHIAISGKLLCNGSRVYGNAATPAEWKAMPCPSCKAVEHIVK